MSVCVCSGTMGTKTAVCVREYHLFTLCNPHAINLKYTHTHIHAHDCFNRNGNFFLKMEKDFFFNIVMFVSLSIVIISIINGCRTGGADKLHRIQMALSRGTVCVSVCVCVCMCVRSFFSCSLPQLRQSLQLFTRSPEVTLNH